MTACGVLRWQNDTVSTKFQQSKHYVYFHYSFFVFVYSCLAHADMYTLWFYRDTFLKKKEEEENQDCRCLSKHMRCCRKKLCISYEDHVTNEEVRAKIQQAIGPHEDLLAIVERRKLQWYGHVYHSSGLAKTIL